MHSLTDRFLASLSLDASHASTLRALGEHRGEQDMFRQQSPAALETLRTVALVESTESSNRLEGVVAAPDRLRDVVLRDSAPRDRSEQEIAGQLLGGRGAKTALVEAAVARRAKPFAILEIARDCPGVSRDMIRHVLRRLRDKGLLRVDDRGRGAKWRVVSHESP